MGCSHDVIGAEPAWPAGSDRNPAACPEIGQTMGQESGTERPIEAAGLVLGLDGDDFRIAVVDQDGATFLALGPFCEDEVLDRWRALAEASGLARMIRDPDGELICAEPENPGPGRGRVHDRGRLVLLTGRRPRFLVRRKVGRMPRRPLVYREPEIVAGTR